MPVSSLCSIACTRGVCLHVGCHCCSPHLAAPAECQKLSCSLFIGGLDVFELKVTVGSTVLYVRNNDPSLVMQTQSSSLPGLAVPWFDQEGALYGITFATDSLTVPGNCAQQDTDQQLAHD